MRILLATIAILMLAPDTAPAADKGRKLYRWVDSDGIVHFDDTIPAEYADLERHVVNERGVTVGVLRAKRTDEQIAEDKREEQLRIAREVQKKKDAALLSTYLTVDEIIMHRDRRVELFQAQSRVTELYLRNLRRRLAALELEASKFKPYSDDPDAKPLDEDLATELSTTKETIGRYQTNLDRYNKEEENVLARFNADISRFRVLKGVGD